MIEKTIDLTGCYDCNEDFFCDTKLTVRMHAARERLKNPRLKSGLVFGMTLTDSFGRTKDFIVSELDRTDRDIAKLANDKIKNHMETKNVSDEVRDAMDLAFSGDGIALGKDLYDKVVEGLVKVDRTAAGKASIKTPLKNKQDLYADILEHIEKTYVAKNADYGDSFSILWAEEGFTAGYLKIADKFHRIKSIRKQEEQRRVKDETLKDTLLDLANYCIMSLIEMGGLDNDVSK